LAAKDGLETAAFEVGYWLWSSGSVGHYEYTVVVGVEMVVAL